MGINLKTFRYSTLAIKSVRRFANMYIFVYYPTPEIEVAHFKSTCNVLIIDIFNKNLQQSRHQYSLDL